MTIILQKGTKHIGKGEIACNKQLLLFHHIFKRLELLTGKNRGLFGKQLTKIVGKGGTPGTRYFLLSPHNIFYCMKKRIMF